MVRGPKRRSNLTEADLKRLNEAHRILTSLMMELNVSTSAYCPPLYASAVTVRACAQEWSGDPQIWNTANVSFSQRTTG